MAASSSSGHSQPSTVENVRQEMLRAVVLARTRSPLIFPSAEQRGGYVPNVTYSCGALVPNGCVLLPYGVGDELTEFAVATIDDLLSVMVSN
jgi:predicted GH43/DUF377 family glycosyl hydrolase